MIASRVATRAALSAVAILALALSACSQPAPAPAPPVQTEGGAMANEGPVSAYACDSGQTVAVRYAGLGSATGTADLTYNGQRHVLRTAAAASGARYVGDGLEWWTTTRGDRETALLSQLDPREAVSAAILERCSRPSAAAVAPIQTPLPTDPASPAPGGVLLSSAACVGSQLKLSSEGGDAGMGNRVASLGLRNVSGKACSLTGYPDITLLAEGGKPIESVRADRNPGNMFRTGAAPTPVDLKPGDLAYFDLAWNVVPNEGNGETVCPAATVVKVRVPGDAAPLSFNQDFTPCGGRIRVGPLRATLEDQPPASAPTATATPKT